VERSTKFELRFIDTQRLNAVVKRGRWNSELRSGARRPGDTAATFGESSFDDLPFVAWCAF
jgi:hypothetical protein